MGLMRSVCRYGATFRRALNIEKDTLIVACVRCQAPPDQLCELHSVQLVDYPNTELAALACPLIIFYI